MTEAYRRPGLRPLLPSARADLLAVSQHRLGPRSRVRPRHGRHVPGRSAAVDFRLRAAYVMAMVEFDEQPTWGLSIKPWISRWIRLTSGWPSRPSGLAARIRCPPVQASSRVGKTSSWTSSCSAAAIGMAASAPMTPISSAPMRTATTVAPPDTFTARPMIFGVNR
jgi:hypothetical protein